nr:putative late blight resistance protein homolog R1B-17 [Ipomoea batatas]
MWRVLQSSRWLSVRLALLGVRQKGLCPILGRSGAELAGEAKTAMLRRSAVGETCRRFEWRRSRVTSLMRSLEFQFLHPQPRLTLSNKKQIESLHEKLDYLLDFLDKFEKSGDNLLEMRAVTEEIIDVSVKAEDDIEEELLSDDQTKLEETLQRVVDEVEKLVQITTNLAARSDDLSNTNLRVGGSSSSQQHTARVDNEDANAMVGHSEELDRVVKQLLDDRNKTLQVMAMVGMGGIGKTTFAKKNYDHPRVKSRFPLRAWTTLSQDHNKGQAILDLCRCDWYLRATSFKKLIVIDLSKIDFKCGVPGDITDLVFLRYLALASSSMLLNHIPLDKNWNLQTLIISGEGDDKDAHKLLPHGIWDNLQQLRHLEINHKLQVSIDLVKVQENLQTLYWLSISQCTAEVFMRIPNVKELGIVAGGDDEVSPKGLNNLCCLNYLEKLRVEGSDDHPLHLPPQPEGDIYIFPQSLKELTFVSTRIPWSEMSIISMLPNLEVLKLKNFACTGQEWELNEDGGFPKLKVVIISRTDLKEWKANVDAPFPKLERLLLKKCLELEEMPDWIEDIATLQLIKLVHCCASLVDSAKQIKEGLDVYGRKLDVLES